MLYMSDDGKQVFKTERECCEYEQKIENDRIKKEKLEMERQDRLEAINKKYEELQDLILAYRKDYDVRVERYSMGKSRISSGDWRMSNETAYYL